MKEQLNLIVKINEFDGKIGALEAVLENIPERRLEIAAALQAQKASLNAKVADLADREKMTLGKEREVEQSVDRLKNLEGKLSSLKTNKEFQAATKEISETKKANKLIEEEIIKAMSEIEALKRQVSELEKAFQDKQPEAERELQDLEEDEGRLKTQILEMERQKEQLQAAADPKILNRYDRVRKIRRDAVSFVEGGNCLGCHMRIPPQLYIEIQKLKGLHTCPSCLRLLFLREWQPSGATGEAV